MSPELDRTKVTFEQAEGLDPVPAQLKPKELSSRLRAGLWAAVHAALVQATQNLEWAKPVLKQPWRGMLQNLHIWHHHKPADEYSYQVEPQMKTLKAAVMHGPFEQVYGTLQYLLRCRDCPRQFHQDIKAVLAHCHAGYRLIDGPPPTLVPVSSEEEARASVEAFVALNTSGAYQGAKVHFVSASSHLTEGEWRDAIRESMQAVESVARVITGEKTFALALKVLESRWKIHGALKAGFGKIYDYTSAEQGLRHPLLDDPTAAVDEADAMFMFGACATFVTYLIRKSGIK